MDDINFKVTKYDNEVAAARVTLIHGRPDQISSNICGLTEICKPEITTSPGV